MKLMASILATLVALAGAPGDGRTGRVGETPSAAAAGTDSGRVNYSPPFDPKDFVEHVDNPYFPLTPGTTRLYALRTEEDLGAVEEFVTFDTKTILGVKTTVVLSKEMMGGALVEQTSDWYAQDKHGNVWYFGEYSEHYRDGEFLGTRGSWEAGKDDVQPGIIMPANPRIRMTYRQECRIGEAEDFAEVLSRSKRVSVPYGTFEKCLQTAEWTPLEPGGREFKYYAPGVGLVLEVEPGDNETRLELAAVSPPGGMIEVDSLTKKAR
ncbi:MAG: hypothetical protein JSW03_09755 [Candidatus Eiseniibacteriota bacterium]|nr:MAG: hypothetical protein JSW03_09755 [Candidatus Eisenbacteria bacterium]